MDFAVHGFTRAEYNIVEGGRVDTYFQLNVKGETNLTQEMRRLSITGRIIAEAGTAGK